MSRYRFGWTFAGLAVATFLALMFLIVWPVKADVIEIPYLSVAPDWLIKYYFDGRTVKV